ncbi:MAG: hypothetical protein WCH99_06510 [Verrucomicrobiota bacterium]
MRVSSQSHTLAVLRILVGLTQKEMSVVLHCSVPTIQAIELNRLKLSEKLAGLASLNTGINLTWLLNNDVTKPPIDIKGQAYTKATFEDFQAIAEIRRNPYLGNELAIFYRDKMVDRLQALLIRAYINNDTDLCVYKLSKAFDELEKQFRVTEADRKAIYSHKRPPELEARLGKDEPLSWDETISGFEEIVDLEEKNKISTMGLKPYSQAQIEELNVKRVYVNDDGQVIVDRISENKPINKKLK